MDLRFTLPEDAYLLPVFDAIAGELRNTKLPLYVADTSQLLSGLIPSIVRYAVIGRKLQVPA